MKKDEEKLKKLCLEYWNKTSINKAVEDINKKDKSFSNCQNLGIMQGFRMALEIVIKKKFKNDIDFLNFIDNERKK